MTWLRLWRELLWLIIVTHGWSSIWLNLQLNYLRLRKHRLALRHRLMHHVRILVWVHGFVMMRLWRMKLVSRRRTSLMLVGIHRPVQALMWRIIVKGVRHSSRRIRDRVIVAHLHLACHCKACGASVQIGKLLESRPLGYFWLISIVRFKVLSSLFLVLQLLNIFVLLFHNVVSMINRLVVAQEI